MSIRTSNELNINIDRNNRTEITATKTQTSSEKWTPKHVKPKNKDIPPSDCKPELNPGAAEQLQFVQKTKLQTQNPSYWHNVQKQKFYRCSRLTQKIYSYDMAPVHWVHWWENRVIRPCVPRTNQWTHATSSHHVFWAQIWVPLEFKKM